MLFPTISFHGCIYGKEIQNTLTKEKKSQKKGGIELSVFAGACV